MGIVAVIMGALGLIISILPFFSAWALMISWLAWLFVILAIVFGIIAIVKKKKMPGFIGLGLGVLTIVMYFVAASMAANAAVDDFNAALNDPALQQQMNDAMNQAMQQGLQAAPPAAPAQPAQ